MTVRATHVDDDWVPATAEEWYTWLAAEEATTVAAYRGKPIFLIAEYRRERAIARDYEGREILELLQNANDQGAERDEKSRVLIELSRDGLIVANTGMPFSVGGVSSLQTSHLSPKRHGRTELIGNKGLGFRSVLNWSRTPIILSKTLSIAWSERHARATMESLIASDEAIAREIAREQKTGEELILPLLPFPLYTIDGNLAPYLTDEPASRLFGRCKCLLQNYDTVVGMPFDAPGAYEAAQKQIDDVHPEILLFVQNLAEISFANEGEVAETWRLAEVDGGVQVLANGDPLGTWEIHRRLGELPDSHREGNRAGPTNYEIVVALPLDHSAPVEPLYSHFPTDIALPLPVVCHATLELEQNRKHALQGRKSNTFVLTELAHFLAEIAEARADGGTDDPWAGCSLLMARTDYPNELTRERFADTLIEAAKTKCIVPSLAGKPIQAAAARIVTGADSSWLPARIFPEVVPLRGPADTIFLKTLGVDSLSGVEIRRRIIAAPELTLEERAALMVGLIERPQLRDSYTSALFIDTASKPLEDELRVFLAPLGGDAPSLPDWVDLRFLHQGMRGELSRRLDSRDARELQQRLSGFGLVEYSLSNLIRTLVAESNRAIKKDPENTHAYRTDLLNSVFGLYLAEEPEKRRPDYPEQSQLYLPTQTSKSAPASTLYLGSGFGEDGEVVQALYGTWAPGRLVDARTLSELTCDSSTLKAFLIWVGVAQWPRDVDQEKPDPGYLTATLKRIVYPARFEEKVVQGPGGARSPLLTHVRSVDGLDRILEHAGPAAVCCWLAKDARALDWARPAFNHSTLQAYPDGVTRARNYQGPVISYVRWKIETTPWLQSPDGASLQPKDCVLGERNIEKLFPRPRMPSAEVLERFGVASTQAIEGWHRAGVLTSLAYLERDEIYAKLLELPIRSRDGKLAKPLYTWLLDASETALGGDGANQKEFLARGKMWGSYGGVFGYYPIIELHHVDSEGLPQPLLERLRIVDLPKRVGAEKVERLFGVKPVDRAGIQRRIAHLEVAVGSTSANKMFQVAKPYLHKLRAAETRTTSQLQALKDLRLEMCSILRGEISFDATSLEYEVPVWGWVIDDGTLYIRSDPAKPLSFSEALFSNAVCEALASLFRIADGGDFARILACPEGDRVELLRRLRGDIAVDDDDAIEAEYAAFTHRALGAVTFPVAEPPEVIRLEPELKGLRSPETVVPPTRGHTPAHETVPDQIEITERKHTPEPPAPTRKLVVRGIVRYGGGGTITRRPVVNGEFCERKVMEFETNSEPPRWPLPVGHIMGDDGPSCDILCFESEEARDAFRKGPVYDLGTVSRFIEVKGRGDAGATIELRGGQLTAAEIYGDRYFLYRLFESENDAYELTVLENPLAHKDALQPAVHVGMEQAAATRRFTLTGGLTA